MIHGYQDHRDAVASTGRIFDIFFTRSEDFGARASTSQQTCLEGVRTSDVVVFLLGANYGQHQESGRSATHEEWREAVNQHRHILVFIERIEIEDIAQQEFIEEVNEWARGRQRDRFTTVTDLRDKVIKALHHLIVSEAANPVNERDTFRRAQELVIVTGNMRRTISGGHLGVAVSGVPRQQAVRPSTLESPEFCQEIHRAMLSSSYRLFDPATRPEFRTMSQRLFIEQSHALLIVDEWGSVHIAQDAASHEVLAPSGESLVLFEELVDKIANSLRLCCEILDLDCVDSLWRMPHVSPVAYLSRDAARAWSTKKDRRNIKYSDATDRWNRTAHTEPRVISRASLRMGTDSIALDLAVLLRRHDGITLDRLDSS